MLENEILNSVSKLTPTQFENLVFDIVRVLGFENVVWRTPGADGGRDIEAYLTVTDPTGHNQVQKWYVECKRYEKSIDWATVWNKLSHADCQNADVLFLVTNSTPSPKCVSRISEWNNQRRVPAIRVWRGYEFPSFLRANLDLAVAHGIISPEREPNALGAEFALELAKLIQSAHGAIEFGSKSMTAIEAASALAELLEHRLRDLKQYGRFAKGPDLTPSSIPDWLKLDGPHQQTEEVGFRALALLLRHLAQCETVSAIAEGQTWVFSFEDDRRHTKINFQQTLKELSIWLRCDSITVEDANRLRVQMRK